MLVSGSDDFSIKIWDTATGKEIKAFPGHLDVVHSLVFFPDGKSLASTSQSISGDKKESATVKLWDVATWEEKVKLKDNDGAFGLAAFSPDGKVVAAFENHSVKLWDTATGKPLATFNEESANIRGLVFSPDSKTLIVGVHARTGDDPIRFWNWADKKPNGSLKLDGECMDLQLTRDGKKLVTLNKDGELTFWDFENARPKKTVKTSRSPGWYGGPINLPYRQTKSWWRCHTRYAKATNTQARWRCGTQRAVIWCRRLNLRPS